MYNNKSQLSIDYNKVALNDPQSFVKYALEIDGIIKEQTGGKSITKISYMNGNYKKQGKARICFDGFSEICIDTPKDEYDNAKLANLLWTLSRGGTIPSRILFICNNKSYEVCTVHTHVHAGKLQRQIKESLENKL